MLSTFIVVFTFMVIIVVIMAVGVIFGRKPISGSCGGMSAIGMESECDVCGGDKTKCDKDSEVVESQGSQLGFDATTN
jgi:hypothetical protein